MSRHFIGYKKQDRIIALVIILVVFLIAQAHITRGMPNFLGGDFSAYITTGRAIAEGTFEEQAVLNHIVHPSPLPEEAGEGQLVYAWGYPLLLSLVYRLVGLDLTNYSTILFYKIPSLIALALTASILFWMTYEIRLNGITIILAIAHLIRLFRTKPSRNPKSVLLNVAHYLLFSC